MSTNGKTTSQMKVSELHHRAMESFDDGLTLERAGDRSGAEKFYRAALELESAAADRVASRLDHEPTRSVLHRSAAAIALRCREHRQAEKLIATALSGNPPEEIAEEMRSLLDQVNFDRHMQLRGLKLAPNELQISVAGQAVGDGIAQSEEFVGRVQVCEKMLIRMIERKSGRPFRETGRVIKEISDRFQLYLSTPRAASFAITLRVGLPDDQPFLTGMQELAPQTAGEVVGDVLECLAAFNEPSEERLRELIPEPDYRRNFVALARQLAPDGNRVKLVGLTAQGGDSVKKLAFDRPRSDAVFRADEQPAGERVEVTGWLLFANATSRSNMIRIVDDAGAKQPFAVPTGMMADIVRPLWETRVRAIGVRKGKRKVELQDIDKIRDDPKPMA